MKTLALFLALTAAPNPSSSDCVGPLCLTHTALVLTSRFNFPTLGSAQFSWSLAARDKSAFALVAIDEEDPEQPVSFVLISSEPLTTSNAVVASALRPSHKWRTFRGIALGHTRAQVVRAYGPPTHAEASGTYPWAGREGVESLDYSGCDSDQSSTTFFIRNGHVVGIAIWAPDC